jgi:general secretion pathway protein G
VKRAALAALGLIALVLLAAKLLLPNYVTSLPEARERVVRQELVEMRALIGQYTFDLQKRPHSLNDLVVAGYLKDQPIDPTTGRRDTWIVECSKELRTPGIIGITAASEHRKDSSLRLVKR